MITGKRPVLPFSLPSVGEKVICIATGADDHPNFVSLEELASL
jgi:hypothetical protein